MQIDAKATLLWIDLKIEPEPRRVYRGSARLEIKGLTFDLLLLFARTQGSVVTVDQIAESVWEDDVVGNEVVTQRVRMLRRALEDDPADPRYVATVRGRGYRALRAAASAPNAGTTNPIDSRWLVRLAWAVVGVVVVSAALVFLLRPATRPHADDPLLERARYYSQLGQADNALRAIALYREILTSSPDNVDAKLGLSFSLSQRVCQNDDEPELAHEAAQLAAEVLQAGRQPAQAHAAFAYANDCLGQISRALEGYLRAYELEPDRAEALASAAHLMEVQGRLSDALEHNLEAVKTAGSRRLRFADIQIARVLDLMDFDAAAQARYARTVKLYPDNVFAAAAQVRFLLSRGKLEESRMAANQAEALGAASSDLYLLQAELAALAGNAGTSEAYLRKVGEFPAPGSWGITLAGIASGKDAKKLWLEGRVREVVDAVAQGDRWPSNWLELAFLYDRLGRSEEATAALREAVAHGYLDRSYLTHSYWFASLRQTAEFSSILASMRDRAVRERDKAMVAPWWENDLILPPQ